VKEVKRYKLSIVFAIDQTSFLALYMTFFFSYFWQTFLFKFGSSGREARVNQSYSYCLSLSLFLSDHCYSGT